MTSCVATLTGSFVGLETTRGLMRVHLFTPTVGTPRPAIIVHSEIFQSTGPIRRMASALAGEGYLVAVPEVYHEFEPLGTVLAHVAEGSARGNSLKTEKKIASHDKDTEVVVGCPTSAPTGSVNRQVSASVPMVT
jgi:carboxymethylenebutenolidase